MAHLLAPSKKYLIAAVVWTLVIAYLCLESSADLPKVKIFGIDKIVHCGFHFVFVILWFLFFWNNNSSKNFNKFLKESVLLSFSYGITIEIAQQIFTTTRQADVFDVLANTTGAILAYLVIQMFHKQAYFH
ncbi:MAG: VanZ family protein [Flavobacterium sp.]|nr:VanZ family protein [Flavobacterium sp.]